MKLTWLKNGFICKELYAPFKISKDIDYRNDLEKKYNIVMEQAKKANADDESLRIINVFSTKILESLDCITTRLIILTAMMRLED